MMRYDHLYEGYPQTVSSNVFAIAKKAFAQLGHDAKAAVESWETMNWTGGVLEKHILAGDEVAAEIEAAFAPVRAALPPMITLYRGLVIRKEDDGSAYNGWQKAYLTSWTSDRRTAELFAGLRRGAKWQSVLYDEVPEEEIQRAVAQYNAKGFTIFKGRYYIQNKEAPEYYNIYDKSKQYVTDGDDLEDSLRSDKELSKELNDGKRKKARVLEEEISRDRIVWLTNSLNCKEFLVKPA